MMYFRITPDSFRNPRVEHSKYRFDFMGLPAEIRLMVYPYIILEPGMLRPIYNEWVGPKCTPKEYIMQKHRDRCHETSKSLLLVSRRVREEVLRLFYTRKTVILSRPGREDTMLKYLNDSLMALIRHVEFDLALTEKDIGNKQLDLKVHLWSVTETIKNHLRRLPQLQSVELRLVQARKRYDASRELSVQEGCRVLLAHKKSRWTPWQCAPNFDHALVRDVIEDGEVFYNFGRKTVHEGRLLPWQSSNYELALCKSQWKDRMPVFVHCVRFTKRY